MARHSKLGVVRVEKTFHELECGLGETIRDVMSMMQHIPQEARVTGFSISETGDIHLIMYITHERSVEE